MTRLPDWEARLVGFIEDHRDRPFSWGHWDCILMACSAVEAMTGDDPAADFRGQYDDRKGAALALREIGEGTLLRTLDKHFDRRPVGKARRGDLVMRKGAIGICVGETGLFVGDVEHGENGEILGSGLVVVPRSDFEKAWTV